MNNIPETRYLSGFGVSFRLLITGAFGTFIPYSQVKETGHFSPRLFDL